MLIPKAIDELTPELKKFLNATRSKLKGSERREFMTNVVLLLGRGGQSRAERELGWDRKTIGKGIKELKSGIRCIDNFDGRRRNRAEHHLPNLLEDIKQIVEPVSQSDPTFRTTDLYLPLTAAEAHRRLVEQKNYNVEQLPTPRTISNKLNDLGLRLKKVDNCKPKKIAQTDAIFSYVHWLNEIADQTDGVIRISIDTKANVNVGAFSRGGYSRQAVKADDHDFGPEMVLKPFGIFLPAYSGGF
jgi:hypothetical protein